MANNNERDKRPTPHPGELEKKHDQQRKPLGEDSGEFVSFDKPVPPVKPK